MWRAWEFDGSHVAFLCDWHGLPIVGRSRDRRT
jgi:hypothetical protein